MSEGPIANPRYIAYATSNGRSPEDQLVADRARWPGGSMCGFIIWNSARISEFHTENPGAFFKGPALGGGDSARPNLVDHEAYDSWLDSWAQNAAQRLQRDHPSTSYFVLNGHTLGYIYNDRDPSQFGVLHGNPLLGGHDAKNGPVRITSIDRLQPATHADFETFRVDPTGHLDPSLDKGAATDSGDPDPSR